MAAERSGVIVRRLPGMHAGDNPGRRVVVVTTITQDDHSG